MGGSSGAKYVASEMMPVINASASSVGSTKDAPLPSHCAPQSSATLAATDAVKLLV